MIAPALSLYRNQALMFGVMLVAAIGNTGLQSVLPAIGRSIGLPDPLIAFAFSLSALLWMVSAPFWAKRTNERTGKRMVLTGMAGFALSLLICGMALLAGVRGWASPAIAFAIFIVGRGAYGLLGSAAPPAAQALVVSSTAREERTKALTLLASAFGVGTIVGPALAPFFVLPFVGLVGPAFVFAALGLAMIILIQKQLHVTGAPVGHPRPDVEPALGSEPVDAAESTVEEAQQKRVRLADPRVRPWLICSVVSTHVQAIINQTIAFLVIDRLALQPAAAQPMIGLVLTAGAGASLLAQWGVIPRLNLQPRQMVLWGAAITVAGALATAYADDLHMLAIAFATSALGFGFLRPGYTAGASLAVEEGEQAAVAGYVTAINGGSFALGPAIGILLYQASRPLPYLVSAVLMAGLLLYALRRARP
jgi:MFS family permease